MRKLLASFIYLLFLVLTASDSGARPAMDGLCSTPVEPVDDLIEVVLPVAPGNIVADGRSFAISTSPRLTLDLAGEVLIAHVAVETDLGELQGGFPSLVQSRVNKNDTCDEVFNAHTVSLSPHDTTLRIFVAAHYEKWSCSFFGKHRLFEQNGSMGGIVTPVIEGGVIAVRITVTDVDADGAAGVLLRDKLFGSAIRDALVQAVPQVIQLGKIQELLPPGFRELPIQFRNVTFYDRGGGRLGVRANASLEVPPELAETLVASLPPF